MTCKEKVAQLAAECRQAVIPLIDRDYYLLGLPYHNNIGDILIWEGERNLLKSLPYKCLGVCGWASYPKKPLKNKDVAILIHGGGYLGDIWRNGWEYAINCIRLNPENRIIVMPNTLHYDDKALIAVDRAVMEQCRDLTLCMRDSRSLALAREYFPRTRSILVPDMAFCINPDYLNKWTRKPSEGSLLLKRKDKELASTPIPASILATNPAIRDWPPMEAMADNGQFMFSERVFNFVADKAIRLSRRNLLSHKAVDSLYSLWYRPMMTRIGVKFVSSYRRIYTTRLHVMILSVLLGRECWLIDNSYGKLSSFYNTWLSDCDCVNYLKL
ncbi:MAG: polysaccharide pyruvyl transferase family protein [Bacteroides sp.]|nr:polysaccharide pyruvyl transferase family protein [Bacteroides sp.]MCM1378732.1 polysaccharide pyruvyl transferase family protein [Bacteroides sp.]MCM1445349.1 polysaccharide pyruvyl transferase family protein [Prevotella sp.]